MQSFAAPVDAADQYGETPLHWAADRGQANEQIGTMVALVSPYTGLFL